MMRRITNTTTLLRRDALVRSFGAGLAAVVSGKGTAESATLTCPNASVVLGNQECADVVVRDAIQALLDARQTALLSGDRTAFLATLDLRNPTWRRIQLEVFDRAFGSKTSMAGVVDGVEWKGDGYVRASISFSRGGLTPAERGSWIYFRRSDGSWGHSEPPNEDLGPRRTLDRDAFVLSYYDWDSDLVDRVANVGRQAWDHIGTIIELPTGIRPTLSLNPTYSSHSGLRGSNTWAAYLPGSRGTVLLRSPGSYGAGTFVAGESEDERMLVPVTHELTHLVNDQIVSLVRIPHWMSEGLAEHVAENLRVGELTSAMRSGKRWTLDKASDVIEWGIDPARNYSGADISLAYAFAAHGVRYLILRFGIGSFWDLGRLFSDTRKWETAFAAVTGIAWTDFGADFHRWLATTYP